MIDKNEIKHLQTAYNATKSFMDYLESLRGMPWPSYVKLTIDAKDTRVLTITDIKLIREIVGFAHAEMEKKRKEIIDALSENSNT